ncbi:MAG: 3-oxoacyl-[acyl-carrier-protein] reductase [Actinobacteria bacterium]|nr:3-oxoacyl-[acyl-carrier-protein] reductase [Actinomycetota bacterium]MCL5069449.1 3-oxoacyl-[acyl-carrier-protein] reductase [Actinomycetota bacterium]
MKLENKICVITGGAAGIGKKISQCFLQEGATVYIFDINQVQGDNTIKDLSSIYGKERVFYKNVNVADESQVEKALDEIAAIHQSVDVLVNNAGITRDNLIMRMSLEDWKKVIDINLTGSFICSKSVIRHMIKKRSGKIINISSIVGIRGNAGQCNYSASKAGLIGLTKSLAREVASRSIMVNAIAPGYIETEMTEKLDEKIKEKLLTSIPAGKLGRPEDVAMAALFLASKDSDYMTGTVLNLDGGMGI